MKTSFLLAAVSGIVMGATSLAQADVTSSSSEVAFQGAASQSQKLDSDAGTKHACKGQNACKGQGGCRTDGKPMK